LRARCSVHEGIEAATYKHDIALPFAETMGVSAIEPDAYAARFRTRVISQLIEE
jgi:hypothetical protein